MATSIPVLFLSVAGAILYIMLRRMVEQQRGQIGILKALVTPIKKFVALHELSHDVWSCGRTIEELGALPSSPHFTGVLNMPGLRQFLPVYFECIFLPTFAAFAGCQVQKSPLLHPAEQCAPGIT